MIRSGIPLLLRNWRKLRGAATSFSGVRPGFIRTSLTTPGRPLRNMGRSLVFGTVSSGANRVSPPLRYKIEV